MSTMLKDPNRHIHVYERRQTNKDYYRCIDSGCSHFQKFDLLIGKEANCVKCKKTFLIEKQQISQRNKHLVCLACSKSPRAKTLLKSKQVVGDIFNDLTKQEEIESNLPYSMSIDEIRKEGE